MSKIIVVEGPDRVGKQTQTKLLQEYFTEEGFKSKIVEVPIRSAVTYKIIYWMLKNGLAKRLPKTFQFFQFLNRKIFQLVTLPHLKNNFDVIIMDRWSLSTTVYGAAEGVSKTFTSFLAKALVKPDHTIILHGKSFAHEAEDVYESDSSLQEKVRIGYAQWAAENPCDCTLINCQQNKFVIHDKICSVLESKGLVKNLICE